MRHPNQRLIMTLVAGWAAFLGLGVMVRQVFSAPAISIVIDRSYCEPADWNQVVEAYQKLYEQHQKQQIAIESVILFSDLGDEMLAAPPPPAEIAVIQTYGRTNPERQKTILQNLGRAELLTCP